MIEKSWEVIHRIFEKMRELLSQSVAASGPSGGAVSVETGSSPPESRPALLGIDEMIGLRAEIRSELDFFRAALAEHLGERDCYLVVFPIVAHFDELVQTKYLDPEQMSWPTLQRELFQVDDAGELFYDTLDDLLLKPKTLPLIFEVFYLCLSDGFRGRYAGNTARIAEYKERLRSKIPVEEPGADAGEPADTVFLEDPGSPAWYYVIDFGFILLLYFVLNVLGRLSNPGF